jgi:hypothetical protein
VRQLLTSRDRDGDFGVAGLGMGSPCQRLRGLDSVAFSKLKTTSLHMAALYRYDNSVVHAVECVMDECESFILNKYFILFIIVYYSFVCIIIYYLSTGPI